MADERERWKGLIPQMYVTSSNDKKERMDKTAGVEKKADMLGGSTGVAVPGFGGVLFTRPLDYRPEFASPDRWSVPYNFAERVKYWRMFFAVDPLIGTTIDLYCDMPLSDYTLVGSGVEGEVKEVFEQMLDELNFIFLLKSLMVEYLVTGEAICHLNYDKNNRIFTDWNLFKPEHCEIYDMGLFGLETVVKYTPPDETLKELRNIKNIMGMLQLDDNSVNLKFVDKLVNDKAVVFDPINTVFIARRLHAYDLRGMSLISRLWRVLMYEDAVMNTTLQTAKRHAAPVKTVTMGDIAAGYVPTQEQVDALLRSLAQAEADPQAWIFVPPGTRFDAWGTTERIMGISKEYDIIERMKLIGLGVSKDFVLGTSTFASAQASLQVFMSRLLTFRTFMEEVFVKPKLFQTIAKVRAFKLPTQAEVEHKIITDKKDRGYIIPKIRWDKSLRAEVKEELLEAYRKLVNDFGVKLSQRTVFNLVGLDWKDEIRKILQEKGVVDLLQKLDKKEALSEQERGFLSELGGGGSFGGGLEGIAPEPVAVENAEELKMHASAVDERVTDEMVKEFMIKNNLIDKEDGKSKKGDDFLIGNTKKGKYIVDLLTEKEIEKRLDNKD